MNHPRSFGDERDIYENVRRIRQAIRGGGRVRFECFNKPEVDATKALLAQHELEHVQFTWLAF